MHYQSCMFSLILMLMIVCAMGHLLLPPFLPSACFNQYYEQKLKISQLDSVEFKISGLPTGMLWTTNGTIYGRPIQQGEWKLTLTYDSITESGTYQTLFIVRKLEGPSTSEISSQLQIVFPQRLIFRKNKEELIKFETRYNSSIATKYNQKQLIQWKFVTLPEGVRYQGEGKLKIKIENQGMYVIRVQVSDLMGNFAQACVTINIQASLQNLSSQAAILYNQSPATSRLIEVKQKQTETTKQLSSAIKTLGQHNQILSTYESAFNKIVNNLIQLQFQANILQKKITESLKSKLLKQQQLKEAIQIIQQAEKSLNLGLIEQQSTNNLLSQAQKEKVKAQQSYEKASRDLDNQLRLMKTIQARLIKKQTDKQVTESVLSTKNNEYSQLAMKLINKEKQLLQINQQIIKNQRDLISSQRQLTSQQSILNTEQSSYSTLQEDIRESEYGIDSIIKEINGLNEKKNEISKQLFGLQVSLQQKKMTQIIPLQQNIKYTQNAVNSMLFEAVTLWKQTGHLTTLNNDYIEKEQFAGCKTKTDFIVQGVFRIQPNSMKKTQTYKQFVVDSGHRVVYGQCTKVVGEIKQGDTLIIEGYTLIGTIQANSIAVATNW